MLMHINTHLVVMMLVHLFYPCCSTNMMLLFTPLQSHIHTTWCWAHHDNFLCVVISFFKNPISDDKNIDGTILCCAPIGLEQNCDDKKKCAPNLLHRVLRSCEYMVIFSWPVPWCWHRECLSSSRPNLHLQQTVLLMHDIMLIRWRVCSE